MSWILDFLGHLLVLLLILLLIVAFISPFEAIGWWSGWSKKEVTPEKPSSKPVHKLPAKSAAYYLVFFTGIMGFEKGTAGKRELRLMELIASKLPDNAVIIDDVFPYSVSNNPLNGERITSGLWKWVDKRRSQAKNIINVYNALIVTRNLFQVAVSADKRYGPLNNAGVARETALSLLRHGYPAGSGKPIYLVCYSGGGQISVGAARYLSKSFSAPIRIISIGGVLTDDPGIAYVDHLTHLQGSRDVITYLGALLYPGRWPILPHSAWNRARLDGRITIVKCGPMIHFGHNDYFSTHSTFPDGESFADRIASLSVEAITADEQQG